MSQDIKTISTEHATNYSGNAHQPQPQPQSQPEPQLANNTNTHNNNNQQQPQSSNANNQQPQQPHSSNANNHNQQPHSSNVNNHNQQPHSSNVNNHNQQLHSSNVNNQKPTPSAPPVNLIINAPQDGGKFVHISDVGTWKHSDRSFWVYVALSIFTGFIGLDHFYLRSNETAIKKLLVNVIFFGFWYFYDIIQILTEGKKIKAEGLSSPLDWIQGIGRGMFAPPKKKEDEEKPKFSAPKSYMIFTILAVVLGMFGADKFYLGYSWQGIVKIISVFSVIFSVFGIFWVLYDAFYALFLTDSIMKKGIFTPPPYSFIFKEPIPAKKLFEVQEEKEEEKKPFSIWDYIPIISFIRKIGGFVPEVAKTVAQDVVQPLVGPSACGIIKHANTAMEIGKIGTSLATSTLATAPALVENVIEEVNKFTDIGQLQKMAKEHAQSQGLLPQIPQIPQIPQMPQILQMPQIPQIPKIPKV